MILRKLVHLAKGQRGFSLIEILAALAITSLIGVGASFTSIQILNQSSYNNNYTTASRHTMNAIYWVSRDAQMSQTIEPDGASGFPLTLSWTEWDNSAHQTTYSIVDDTLIRSHSVDGGTSSETLVAQYVNSASENTTCAFSSGIVTLKITTSVGEGTRTLSVSKVREITPRPGL
ncbi:type II secretion system protein J [Chloroflexota bacterium]